MSLLLSLNIFKNTLCPCSETERSPKTIILYKFKDESTTSPWICSYRTNSSSISAGEDLDISIPSYLAFAGFLVINYPSDFDIRDLGLENKRLKIFYLLTLQEPYDTSSLSSSLSVWSITSHSQTFERERITIDNVIWVEDDLPELKKRNLFLVNVTYSLSTNLLVSDDSLNCDLTGLRKFVDLPGYVRSFILSSFNAKLSSFFLENDDKNTKKIITSEYKPPSNSNCYNLSSDGKVKNLLIVDNSSEKTNAYLKILVQTTIPVSSSFLGDLDSQESLKSVLASLYVHFSKLYTILEKHPSTMYCYISKSKSKDNIEDEVIADGEVKVPVLSSKKPSNPKGKGKRQSNSKQKLNTPANRNTQSVNNENSVEKYESYDFIEVCRFLDANLSIKFDTYGGIDLMPCLVDDNIDGELDTIVNIIFKSVISEENIGKDVKLPFGGYFIPLFNLMSNMDPLLNTLFGKDNHSLRLKLLLNPLNFIDKSVLISPHKYCHQFPPWMSSKTSKLYTINGDYQYYHYTQCNINDVGWGCCYRSIQLVCSWYLLQSYTMKNVPTHKLIQEVLQKNDLSHKDLVIGSSKWIGTVESGYFINWYLNYNCKTLHVTRASDLKNFNRLIADHFAKEGTPIIVGAGSYAYVILGLCMGLEPADFAYLISDPHYVGEDNIKSIQSKGAIGWKKVDFISKAADGNFINLCCPQLDIFEA